MMYCKRETYAWHTFFIVLVLLLAACKRDERGLVVGKIQEASDLATTEFTIDKIVHGTKTKKLSWFLKLSEACFLAYSQAKIKTGIDLSKIRESDISIREDRVVLHLPPIKVINLSYPPSSFVEDSLISDPKAFLNTIHVEDQEVFFRQAELDIRNNLEYLGIVESTQNHTRTMLTRLLRSLGYEEIFISFESDELIIDKVNLLAEEDSKDD